jgi:hypothetical protein
MSEPNRSLSDALEWLQKRTEHRFDIDTGMFVIGDGAIIRGSEPPPAVFGDEHPESYQITFYVPAFTVTLDPDDLGAEIEDQTLRLTTRHGVLSIIDLGPDAGA